MISIGKYIPWIFRGLGYGLSATACIETGKAFVRAHEDIKEAGMEDASLMEKTKMTYKHFIIPAILFGSSVGCHIACDKILLRELSVVNGAIASIVASDKIARDKLDKAIKDVVGEKKAKAIHEKVLQNDARDYLPETPDVIEHTGYGDSLFYEPLTGKWFLCSHEHVINTKIVIKELMDSNDVAYVNDVLYELGLKPCEIGKRWGWNKTKIGGSMDIGWTGSGSEDDRYKNPRTGEYMPYSILTYSDEPEYESEMYG